MSQKLIIPRELPALNEAIAESKRHWSQYAEMKRKYTTIVASLAKKHLSPISEQVHLHFDWYCKYRRRDPDNISAGGRKVILDGLVAAKILPNDGWRNVAGFTDRFYVDKKYPRVEVLITEID